MNPWTEARARLYKRGGTWRLEVTSKGKIVGRDNCSRYTVLANQARQEVGAVRYVVGMGHTLKAYDTL